MSSFAPGVKLDMIRSTLYLVIQSPSYQAPRHRAAKERETESAGLHGKEAGNAKLVAMAVCCTVYTLRIHFTAKIYHLTKLKPNILLFQVL